MGDNRSFQVARGLPASLTFGRCACCRICARSKRRSDVWRRCQQTSPVGRGILDNAGILAIASLAGRAFKAAPSLNRHVMSVDAQARKAGGRERHASHAGNHVVHGGEFCALRSPLRRNCLRRLPGQLWKSV